MKTHRRSRFNWTPYLLILPSLIYLTLFFAWPMLRGLTLAFREEGVLLNLREEAERGSSLAGQFPRGAQVEIVDQQANRVGPDELSQAVNPLTEIWFQIRAQGIDGQPLEGWAPERRIRVLENDADGVPVRGSVRVVLGSAADPLTSVYAENDEGSQVIGQLEMRAPVEIVDQETLEVWYLLRGEVDGQPVEGWTQARFIQPLGDGLGRVNQGNAGQYTTRFFERMLADRFFWPALRTTLLLVVLILPVQFVLAMIMALVIQANLKGGGFFLYIFSIALGISDLAVGIVWYAIFTQFGYLNSILQTLGLISAPITFLSANTRHWIVIAVWLAEVWRSTAIVMVILVAGLQAISHEVLEAGEVFGATLWQRIRYIILPLLKPSIQVALILRTILALQVFAVVIVLGGGDIVTVLANETYRQYYELRNFNMAAAYASFVLFLSVFTAFLYLRAVRTQEEMQ